jgi:hypothetical protein
LPELHVANLDSNTNNYKTITIRKIDFNTITEFRGKLSSELRKNVFDNDNNDVGGIFNCFLNTYLQIFYSLLSRNNSKQDSIKETMAY